MAYVEEKLTKEDANHSSSINDAEKGKLYDSQKNNLQLNQRSNSEETVNNGKYYNVD
jgi:hypothetical protein